jgi:hypothetical protein
MLRRRVAFALAGCAGCATLLASPDVHAESPKLRGAIVVALGQGTTAAAKPLAREVYRDEALRPALDDTTARVLTGDPPPEGAPQNLRDLADIRSTLPPSPEDAAGRRLLASLGAEQKAEIVIAVSMVGERTVARVLRVDSARYEPIELGPTVERTETGEARFSWPGVTTTLRKLVTPPPAPAPPKATASGPIAPRKVEPTPPPKAPERAWYASPWFWGPVGAVVVVGAAILIASQVTANDPSTVHLTGRVAP